LLRQGGRRRLPARRRDPPRHHRRQEPRRRDAAGLLAVLGRAGLHRRGVREDRRRGRRDRPGPLLPPRPPHHRRAGLRRGLRLVRPPLRQGQAREEGRRRQGQRQRQARQGLAGPDHQDRGRPADGRPGQARHPRLRGWVQRRRRDPRRGGGPDPPLPVVATSRSLPPRRQGLGPHRPPRPLPAPGGDVRPGAPARLDDGAAPRADRRPEGPSQGLDGRV
ncbi:hypothetical protein HK102_011900, partial [Quaeritorhiza haematococci]